MVQYGLTMEIKPNERVLIAGKTGSGKTWFAGKLLSSIPRLIVVDPKGTLNDWGLNDPTVRQWRKLEKGEYNRIRIRPPLTDDIEAWYEDLFERIYDLGNVTLYIDEAYAVASPGSRPGRWLSALYTRGRERGIGVWAATQRPMWIPLFLISEADWLVVFRLNLAADRSRIASVAGDSVLDRVPDPHGFWLYHVEDDDPHYYSTAVLKS